MNVLSTFNGMGCIWLALDKIGVKVDKRYSSEIDKYANTVNDANYPDTIQLGDITQVKAKDLDKIDLIVGGSPCQGFSFAGKQLNFNDERSKLFFEFVRLLKECKAINPDVKFLLENVNMKREYLGIISKYLGVFPVRINSNLVSAQNRDRWYWTNVKTKKVGLFGDLTSDIEQPEDKGILLKDIVENQVNRIYFYNKRLNNIIDHNLILKTGVWGYDFRYDDGLRLRKNGKSGTLQAQARQDGTGNQVLISVDGVLRRATPIECERLQTVPDNYTNHLNDPQRYKMLGNGWTVDVISHILKYLSIDTNKNISDGN